MAEKIFTPETEAEFTAEELLLALPILIIKNNRRYAMSYRPIMEGDLIRYAVLYRCETNNDFISVKADSPRQVLSDAATMLLTKKYVGQITTI